MFPSRDQEVVQRSREIVAMSRKLLSSSAVVLRRMGYSPCCETEEDTECLSLVDDESSAIPQRPRLIG
jgi:hypothetical protein